LRIVTLEQRTSAKGVILPAVAAAIYGASAYQFSQAVPFDLVDGPGVNAVGAD
jgi:hypothetical protein